LDPNVFNGLNSLKELYLYSNYLSYSTLNSMLFSKSYETKLKVFLANNGISNDDFLKLNSKDIKVSFLNEMF
jgi:hypothetical protein